MRGKLAPHAVTARVHIPVPIIIDFLILLSFDCRVVDSMIE
jgi:hypothetical protein